MKVLVLNKDLTERAVIQQVLQHNSHEIMSVEDSGTAMFDTLTKVLNQKAFLGLARGELERARRGQSPLSLIAVDIDNFKAINDKYGENIGNDVLTVIAKSIREKSRPYDGVGRFEEDMFLIVLPGVIGQDAEKVADRIIKDIQNT